MEYTEQAINFFKAKLILFEKQIKIYKDRTIAIEKEVKILEVMKKDLKNLIKNEKKTRKATVLKGE